MRPESIRKILVPVDFSSCSRSAVGHALALAARAFHASVDILHVWETPIALERHPAPPTDLLATGGMEDLIVAAERESVKVGRLQETGEPVSKILEVAARGNYDLIVMGTHGRTGIAHDYLGSMAEKVIRRAPCAVLTYNERAPYERAVIKEEPLAESIPLAHRFPPNL